MDKILCRRIIHGNNYTTNPDREQAKKLPMVPMPLAAPPLAELLLRPVAHTAVSTPALLLPIHPAAALLLISDRPPLTHTMGSTPAAMPSFSFFSFLLSGRAFMLILPPSLPPSASARLQLAAAMRAGISGLFAFVPLAVRV
jgi:hypothetical protein